MNAIHGDFIMMFWNDRPRPYSGVDVEGVYTESVIKRYYCLKVLLLLFGSCFIGAAIWCFLYAKGDVSTVELSWENFVFKGAFPALLAVLGFFVIIHDPKIKAR